ncbi:electron transfer flavoprotein subunit beta/FixA family protein [Halomicroarcula sp. GCM10025324]|uniref:electron transfer flavoprotein subunit beta/FixA family protein n=1 Tax=Haloarcula TaxID=2237 RepID=UPI0023E79B8D|nr:electron transfer flavoprotein subunit beta/FixA family protein [Halomicroarcula sp. ZS-22-S1]
MKILVTVKQVAVVDDEFEIDGLGIDDRYITHDLNEWDEYAVEEAVQLQEAADEDVEVVTVTIGPEDTEETIRQALAKGADRAVRVWDDTLAEAGLLDPTTKARVVEAVASEEDPDLVLTGVQSADDGFGATGVTLAERLGFEWAAVVNDLELDREAGVASVHRELEGSIEELTDVQLPAVLTIQTGINEPRYASLRGIRQAQTKELDVRSLEDVGLSPADIESPLEQTSLYEPTSESDATVFEGSAEEAAAELAEVLRDAGVAN